MNSVARAGRRRDQRRAACVRRSGVAESRAGVGGVDKVDAVGKGLLQRAGARRKVCLGRTRIGRLPRFANILRTTKLNQRENVKRRGFVASCNVPKEVESKERR